MCEVLRWWDVRCATPPPLWLVAVGLCVSLAVSCMLLFLSPPHPNAPLPPPLPPSPFFPASIVPRSEVGAALLKHGRLQRRATIIPLDKISGPGVSREQADAARRASHGRAREALTLVGYDDEVRPGPMCACLRGGVGERSTQADCCAARVCVGEGGWYGCQSLWSVVSVREGGRVAVVGGIIVLLPCTDHNDCCTTPTLSPLTPPFSPA